MKFQQLIEIIKIVLSVVPRGTFIDVPIIQSMMGHNYSVGWSTKFLMFPNPTWGKALSRLVGLGVLIPAQISYVVGGNETTIHGWTKA